MTEAVSVHPEDGSVTMNTKESLVQIGAVVFIALGFETILPAVLLQLYAIPGVLRIPDKFAVVHPQKSGTGEATASGFGFTVSVSVITWLQPGMFPAIVNTVVTAGATVCVVAVESVNEYAGLAVQA
jgi:hypothetical protein